MLVGLALLFVIAVAYSALVWQLAVRFGPKALFLTCPVAALAFLALERWQTAPQAVLPTSMVVIGAFAALLAFALASRSVWRRVQRAEPLSVRALTSAGGAFLLGMLLGLLPALVLDVFAVARAS